MLDSFIDVRCVVFKDVRCDVGQFVVVFIDVRCDVGQFVMLDSSCSKMLGVMLDSLCRVQRCWSCSV